MKRRRFIKAIGLASAAVVFAKDLFAQPVPPPAVPLDPFIDQPFVNIRGRRQHLEVVPEVKPIFKITGIDKAIGLESLPCTVEPNDDGYLYFGDCFIFREQFCTTYTRYVDQYAIYAPMPGFERTGPWYLMRVISRREARRARFTIVAPTNYRTSDLSPQLCPRERFSFTLPPPAEGQTDWRIYGGDLNGPASVLINVPYKWEDL